jgi:hypothetical protein
MGYMSKLFVDPVSTSAPPITSYRAGRVARQARPKYTVTQRAVDAIREGQAELGIDDVQLALAVGISKQAVGKTLTLIGKRSAYLADMLEVVKKPRYLALDLTPEQVRLLGAYERARKALPKEQAQTLVSEFDRDVDREIALTEKKKSEN